jgi:hypothetical protein
MPDEDHDELKVSSEDFLMEFGDDDMVPSQCNVRGTKDKSYALSRKHHQSSGGTIDGEAKKGEAKRKNNDHGRGNSIQR